MQVSYFSSTDLYGNLKEEQCQKQNPDYVYIYTVAVSLPSLLHGGSKAAKACSVMKVSF